MRQVKVVVALATGALVEPGLRSVVVL